MNRSFVTNFTSLPLGKCVQISLRQRPPPANSSRGESHRQLRLPSFKKPSFVLIFNFIYVYICTSLCVFLCVHVCVCATCVQGLMKAHEKKKKRYQILLEVGVTGGCKLPKTVLGTSSLNTVNMRMRSVFFRSCLQISLRCLLSFCLVRIHYRTTLQGP